ncbi:hypothetical protein Cma02nite_15900 [Cellulomonas marina]|nr:hypothetical protein Cma02nite_15900 [Cellulomonas marina]
MLTMSVAQATAPTAVIAQNRRRDMPVAPAASATATRAPGTNRAGSTTAAPRCRSATPARRSERRSRGERRSQDRSSRDRRTGSRAPIV